MLPFVEYIQKMRNMPNGKLSPEQRLFIDDFAALLAGWNMPGNAARVYGYLLFQTEPAGLDEIAEKLEISKSNACLAAKLLEGTGHCRRITQPGSKRLRYVAREDFGTSFLLRTASLGRLGALMQSNAAKVGTGLATARLNALAGFYETMQNGMEQIIREDTELAQERLNGEFSETA